MDSRSGARLVLKQTESDLVLYGFDLLSRFSSGRLAAPGGRGIRSIRRDVAVRSQVAQARS
jgi:hypothetical protein